MRPFFYICVLSLVSATAIAQPVSFVFTNTGYCNNPCAAGVDVTVDSTAMVPPLSFVWSDGATVEDRVGLCNGYYFVSVTDANGQAVFTDMTLQADPIFSWSHAVTASCGPASGSIAMTASNGSGPLVFLLNGDTVGATVSGLDSGVYEIATVDSLGCTLNDTVYVPYGEPPVACFTTDVEPCTCGDSLTVTFLSCSTPPTVTHNWLIGGGMMQPPFYTAHQTVVFGEPGSFAAGLLITDSMGCSDFILLDNYVYVEPHAVFLMGDDTTEVGSSVIFSAATQPNYSWTVEPPQGVFTSGNNDATFTVFFQQMFTYEVCTSTTFDTPCGGTCKLEACKNITVVDSTGTAVHQPVLRAPALTVFPNPAFDNTALGLTMPLPFESNVLMLDASGRVLKAAVLPAFATTVELDLRDVAAGLYVVSLRNPNGKAIARGKLAVQ